MEIQEIKFKDFLINIFYLKEFIGASKITFQRLPGGFLRRGRRIFRPPLSNAFFGEKRSLNTFLTHGYSVGVL